MVQKKRKNLRLSIKNLAFTNDIDINKLNFRLKVLHNKLPRRYRPTKEQVFAAELYQFISNKRQKIPTVGKRFSSLIIDLGFPPALIMPSFNITRLLKIYDEKGFDYTSRLFERYMTLFVINKDTICMMQNKWKNTQWLTKRRNILDKVVEGHFNGYYELSIPAILAQLEGIIIEGMINIQWLKPGTWINYSHVKAFAKFLLSDIDEYSFDSLITDLFENNILATFTKGEEVTINLSRHAILHGADTMYGTKLNSIKSILIFDYFFHKLDEMNNSLENKLPLVVPIFHTGDREER
jgi:hypothetical protein